MESTTSQLLIYGVNILLVRVGVLVKVTRTYEKDIYPHGTTGPGNGHDADGVQQRRFNFDRPCDQRAAGNIYP